jgi:hypothetical protein
MTTQERNQRRSKIVRRWTAYRGSRAQRRARVGRPNVDEIPDDVAGGADLLAELPDGLIG